MSIDTKRLAELTGNVRTTRFLGRDAYIFPMDRLLTRPGRSLAEGMLVSKSNQQAALVAWPGMPVRILYVLLLFVTLVCVATGQWYGAMFFFANLLLSYFVLFGVRISEIKHRLQLEKIIR